MKKHTLTLVFLLASIYAFSQAPSNISGTWKDAVLRATGETEVGGVEAYSMKATCAGEDYVIVKFVNKNSYRVGVEWVDGIFVNGVWYYSNNTKKLYLEPGETIGACNSEAKLKVKINDIKDITGVTAYYSVTGLAIVK